MGRADGPPTCQMKRCVVRIYHFVFRFLALTCMVGTAQAQQIDPHSVYEKNCAGCHSAHAGAFVFESTDLINGALVGKRTGKPVSDYLAAGHGGLSDLETAALMEHMSSIRKSGRLFQQKCAMCHSNAKDLARATLILRDETLWGRYSGRDIAQFLTNHGRLKPDEVPKMVEVLTRQLVTVPTP